MSAEVQYLTVQDHLWINFQVTQKSHSWNYATLEEAVYYQYGYGGSTNILAQSAQYGAKFARKSPFSGGNLMTSFVGMIAFLELNGYEVNLTDEEALKWFRELRSSNGSQEVLKRGASESDHHGHSQLEEVVPKIMERFPHSLQKLNEDEPALMQNVR